MIHCALLGSIERFISVFIEHTGGWFDFWAAPEQVRILTVNNSIGEYLDEVKDTISKVVLMSPVKYNELRFSVDNRNESLGKKIREASSMKIPLQIIIGPKDMASRQVSARTKSSEQKIHIDKLIDFIEGLN